MCVDMKAREVKIVAAHSRDSLRIVSDSYCELLPDYAIKSGFKTLQLQCDGKKKRSCHLPCAY
jgi:hypothetical protein